VSTPQTQETARWQKPLIAAAVWFGMRTIRLGSRWGWLPIGVASAIGVYFLVLTAIAGAGRLLVGDAVI